MPAERSLGFAIRFWADGWRIVSPGRLPGVDATASAAAIPATCAITKPVASWGLIPAKVRVNARATVTAGLAKDVLAVNRHAANMQLATRAGTAVGRDLIAGSGPSFAQEQAEAICALVE